ncbi:MAG: hypothetical protein LAO09_07930 [Acidobacteriia bacterium]|nr:hypothetical protein [Terriglobia bacterium]
MNELVKLLTDKTGLPDDKARLAIETVIGFLKQRLPSAVGEQLSSCLSNPASEGIAEKVKGVAKGVGNVFTKKAG